MLDIQRIHHVAILTNDYATSKHFYTRILGFEIVQEHFRAERNSYKLDLAIQGVYQIELFSFDDYVERCSFPEAKGLRHLAFEVADVTAAAQHLQENNVKTEEIRVDPYSGKKFLFFWDPNGQPLEIYEK